MNKKYNITKKFLIREYNNKKKSTYTIAKIIGCKSISILYYLKKYKIKRRTKSEAQLKDFNPNYKHGKSTYQHYCIDCGKKIRWRSQYCKNCYLKITCGINHPNWQGGKSFEPYSLEFTEKLKKTIRNRDKYICQLCGKKGKCVHHIDYNKQNLKSNNLVILCSSCHSKTNFNRKIWKKLLKRNHKNEF